MESPTTFITKICRGDAFNVHACFYTGTVSQFRAGASKDDYIIKLAAGEGLNYSAGDFIYVSENEVSTESDVTQVVGVNVDDISISRRLENSYTTDAQVEKVIVDLSDCAAGSLASPVIAKVRSAPGIVRHITTLIFHGESALEPALNQFIGIAKLPNGLLVRHVDGSSSNKALLRENTDFYEYFGSSNVSVLQKSPAGVWGINALWSYAVNTGCAIKLDGAAGDELQLVIQDDLTAISQLEVIAQGYVL